MSNDTTLSDRAAELSKVVRSLQDDLGITIDLKSRAVANATAIRVNRRWITITVAGLALDLMLTIFGGALFLRVNDATDAVREVQEVTASEVLCPLYGIFLHSAEPTDLTPEERAARIAALAVIQAGSDKLGC